MNTMNETNSCGESDDELLVPPVETVPGGKRVLCQWGLAVMLLFFTQNLTSVVFKNQILYQTCTAVYEHNETICRLLGTDQSDGVIDLQDIEKQVEPYAANIFMVRSLLEAIVPSIITLFLGPWSDKFGRKPVILIVSAGFLVSSLLITLLSSLSSFFIINPWFYMLMLLPAALGGGNCSLFSVTYSYIADITTVQERPFKIGIVGGNIAIGLASGSLISGYLYSATNAVTVFGLSAGIILIAIIYTIFVTKESLKQEDIHRVSRIRSLFKMELLIDVLKTCCQKISGSDRIIVWCTVISLGFNSFVQDGSGTVSYLFLRQKFSMTISEFTVYEAINIIALVAGGILGIVILHIYFKISPTTMAILSFGSGTLEAIIKATASSPWHLYLAIGFSALKGMVIPMCRSILATVVPAQDIGKIYSLTTAIESIAPLGSVPLYTYIYSSTLTFYPGAFNAFSTAIFLLSYILMTTVFGTEICVNQRRRN